MIVVADTSPINYLVQLGLVEILANAYGRVILPVAVLHELQSVKAPHEVRMWAQKAPSWVEIRELLAPDPDLLTKLDRGEAEAISLALELGADVLVMDERLGRQEAAARNLRVTGTLALVVEAAWDNRLDMFVTLERLQRLGFRMSSELIASTMSAFRKGRDA